MSESAGAVTWSTDATHVWGSCGFAIPGVEIKVLTPNPNGDGTFTEAPRAANMFHPTEAEQGELCYRGRNIMMGCVALRLRVVWCRCGACVVLFCVVVVVCCCGWLLERGASCLHASVVIIVVTVVTRVSHRHHHSPLAVPAPCVCVVRAR
jgi:hypothetical protein